MKFKYVFIVSILILFGVYANNHTIFTDGTPMYLMIIGGIIILLYWATRNDFISIASNGGDAIQYEINSSSNTVNNEFLFNVQKAKLNRVHSLYSGGNIDSSSNETTEIPNQ